MQWLSGSTREFNVKLFGATLSLVLLISVVGMFVLKVRGEQISEAATQNVTVLATAMLTYIGTRAQKPKDPQ